MTPEQINKMEIRFDGSQDDGCIPDLISDWRLMHAALKEYVRCSGQENTIKGFGDIARECLKKVEGKND